MDLGTARDALARLAREQAWDWFVTQTFRRAKTTLWGAWAGWARAERWLYREGIYIPPARVLVGIEGQRRGTPHVHALVGGSRGILYTDDVWRAWKEYLFRITGIARIYPYNADLGAAYYISKYIVGDDNLDWGVKGEWQWQGELLELTERPKQSRRTFS